MTDREMTEIGDFYACALKKALKDCARVYNYDEPKDFSDLWRDGICSDICGSEPDSQNSSGNKRFVLVWDGRPRSTGPEGDQKTETLADAELLAEHLTPLDWALAFSICALESERIPTVSIHIVDLTGKDHEEWAFRWRHQLLAQMPWVTLHAPLIPSASGESVAYRAGYRPILPGEKCENPLLYYLDHDAKTLKLTEFATLDASSNSGTKDALRELVEAWAATAIRTHDHHDLNNLVGPWILTKEEPDKPWIKALLQKLWWTGLCSEASSSDGTNAEDKAKGALPYDYDVFVIDDLLNRGWDKVILKHFDVEGPEGDGDVKYQEKEVIPICRQTKTPNVYGALNPESLIKDLGWCSDDKHDVTNYLKRVHCKPRMLVIDLKLFSGRATEERAWFRKLMEIAKTISKKCNENPQDDRLAWQGFSQEELKSVEDWLGESGGMDAPAYTTALKLFPRLCALRWPTVPILLFSGTDRRKLVADLVENYHNIFDAPAKPDLFRGDTGENTEAYYEGWQRKIKAAQDLIPVQDKLFQLMSGGTKKFENTGSGEGDRVIDSKLTGQGDADNKVHSHMTIAFDESGDFSKNQYSAIGGVVIKVSGNDEVDAKFKSFEFFEELRRQGVKFYDRPPIYTDITTDISTDDHKKETAMSDALEKAGKVKRMGRKGDPFEDISTLKKKQNISSKVHAAITNPKFKECVKLGVFRCMVDEASYKGNRGRTDSVYLKWLVRTIELLLCEYLPSIKYDLQNLKSSDITLSIWLPTRSVRGVSSEAVQWDVRHSHVRHRHRHHSASDIGIMETLGGHSVAYEIMLHALEGRSELDNILKKCNLKLRKIPYSEVENNGKDGYLGALHWFCETCGSFRHPITSDGPGSPKCNVTIETKDGKDGEKIDEKCKEPLVADYSVAAHLADACLTNVKSEFPNDQIESGREHNINGEISFEIYANGELDKFLTAGRFFDSGMCKEGFETAYHNNFFLEYVKPTNRLTDPAQFNRRLIDKCQAHAEGIIGDDIVRLVSHTEIGPAAEPLAAPVAQNEHAR